MCEFSLIFGIFPRKLNFVSYAEGSIREYEYRQIPLKLPRPYAISVLRYTKGFSFCGAMARTFS